MSNYKQKVECLKAWLSDKKIEQKEKNEATETVKSFKEFAKMVNQSKQYKR